MDDFIEFRHMISPVIIAYGTMLGMIVAAIGGLAGIGVGLAHGSLTELLGGVGLLVLGPLLLRIGGRL
jgi:hypothetical protein